MTTERDPQPILDEPTKQAVAELQTTIRLRYPSATFELSQAPEDPNSIHLITTVDVDDPDEVGDLVLDRVLDLNVSRGIPLHVNPVRTPERIAADKHQRQSSRRRPLPSLSKFGLLRQ
jgi:hypothetical protein